MNEEDGANAHLLHDLPEVAKQQRRSGSRDAQSLEQREVTFQMPVNSTVIFFHCPPIEFYTTIRSISDLS